MKAKTTIILFLLLAGLVIFYFVAVHEKPGTKAWRERQKRLFDIDPDAVTKLEIEHGAERVVLEKQGDTWRLTAPLACRAAESAVRDLARDLDTLEFTDRFEPKKDADYGLEHPAARVTITAAGRSHALRLGFQTALSAYEIYAAVDGRQPVYTVRKSILDALSKPANDWRDKDLLPLLRADVTAVTIDRTDSPTVALVRRDGDWRLTRPLQDAAAQDVVNDLLSSLDGLTVDTFVNDAPTDLATYGLDAPVLNVEVTQVKDGADTRTFAVLLGHALPDDKEKVYAKTADEPFIYAVAAKALTDLSPSAFALRQKHLAAFATDRVTRVAFTGPRGDVVLAKDAEGTWKLEKPAEGKTESGSVVEFLNGLKDAAIEQFLDPPAEGALDLAPLGLDQAQRRTVTLTLKADKAGAPETTLTFHVGGRTEDQALLHLQRAGDSFALAAKTTLDETINLGDLAFRDREVLTFSKSDARELTIVRGGVTYTCSRPDDKDEWSLTAPVKAKSDYSSVSNILWDLSSLRAKALVAEKPADLTAYGLDSPTVTATVTYQSGEGDERKSVSRTLHVGAKADEAAYARLADGDLVFTLRQSIVDDLNAELHERQIMSFSRDNVKSLTIALAGDEPFTLLKDGSLWKLEGRETLAVRSSAADDVLSDLQYLRTERFAAYEAADLAPYGLHAPRVTVTLKLEAEQLQLLVGKALDDGRAYAKTGVGKAVFELSKEKAERLLRGLGDYLADPAATQPTSKPTTEPAAP